MWRQLDALAPTAAHRVGDTVMFVWRAADAMCPLDVGGRGTVTEVRWEEPMPYVEYRIAWSEGVFYDHDWVDSHYWSELKIAALPSPATKIDGQ